MKHDKGTCFDNQSIFMQNLLSVQVLMLLHIPDLVGSLLFIRK